jgi:hypothetical protein
MATVAPRLKGTTAGYSSVPLARGSVVMSVPSRTSSLQNVSVSPW